MEIKKIWDGGWQMKTIRGTVVVEKLKDLMIGIEHQLEIYRKCPMDEWSEDENGTLTCKKCGINRTDTFTPEMFR